MAVELIVRKIGNSLGVVFPRAIVKEKDIRVNEPIVLEVAKKADLRDIFGTLPRKMSGQAFKDFVRKGWE